MKNVLFMLLIFGLFSCSNPDSTTHYFNESGTIVGIQYVNKAVADDYYNYIIRLDSDTTMFTQLNPLNWNFSRCNLGAKKVGDKVYFQQIMKKKFYVCQIPKK